MSRHVIVLVSTLSLACGFAGVASKASANHRCGSCGPIAPTTLYKTVHPQKYLTRYRDVSVYRHVNRIHPIITVTRVQPVIHINQVTRVHHRTISHVVNAYSSSTQYLPPLRYVSNSVQNIYHCGCTP